MATVRSFPRSVKVEDDPNNPLNDLVTVEVLTLGLHDASPNTEMVDFFEISVVKGASKSSIKTAVNTHIRNSINSRGGNTLINANIFTVGELVG